MILLQMSMIVVNMVLWVNFVFFGLEESIIEMISVILIMVMVIVRMSVLKGLLILCVMIFVWWMVVKMVLVSVSVISVISQFGGVMNVLLINIVYVSSGVVIVYGGSLLEDRVMEFFLLLF